MEKKYEKYATLADGVKAAAFATAAVEDYGFWQIIWGTTALGALFNIYSNYEKTGVKEKVWKAGKFGVATFGLAAAIGSAFTGDIKNAQIFGAVAIGFYSDLIGSYFRKKSETKSSGWACIKPEKKGACLEEILGNEKNQAN